MQNLYSYTVPVYINLLGGLKNVLAKAEAHAKETGMSEESFLNDAIYPDMFPLKKQVQVSSDQTKGLFSRLTGKENPAMEDNEETFAQLQERLDKTIAFAQSLEEKDFDGAEDRQITLKYYPGKYMTGKDYAMHYAFPNFLFHVTTAYNIVRKNGVVIGKADFVNQAPFKDLES